MSKLDDLSAWRLFCSLCNTRNFSDTAGEFDVEVSTVSRALTSLENALGQTLILRVTRPLQLTESGQIAYEHASNILLQHEEMVKELTQSSAGMAGKIRLSLAPGSVAVYIPMLMEFNSQYPEIVFDIVGGGNVQDILQYKADISVASFKSKDPRIVSYSRGRNVYVPVASRRYIEEHGMPLHPKDLAAHTVLVYDGSVRSATRYFVRPDYQRMGIGTAICNKLEGAVQGNVFTHASITAKPFFEKRGYKVIKRQTVKRRGVLLTNFVMEYRR